MSKVSINVNQFFPPLTTEERNVCYDFYYRDRNRVTQKSMVSQLVKDLDLKWEKRLPLKAISDDQVISMYQTCVNEVIDKWVCIWFSRQGKDFISKLSGEAYYDPKINTLGVLFSPLIKQMQYGEVTDVSFLSDTPLMSDEDLCRQVNALSLVDVMRQFEERDM